MPGIVLTYKQGPRTIGHDDDKVLPTWELWDSDHTPHWQRPGKPANLHVKARGHTAAHWIDFDVTESTDKHTKRTMFNLSEGELRDLRRFINTVLGDEKDPE